MINRVVRTKIAARPRTEIRKIFDAALYFPSIKPGHGSTHNNCVVKGCKYRDDHYQDPVEAAEQWLVKNGKIRA